MKTRQAISYILFMLILTPASYASIIYDNGGPDGKNGFRISDHNETVDNFTLSDAADIQSVGFYFNNFQGVTGWNHDITYNFYTGQTQASKQLISSGAGQNVTSVDSGQAWCGTCTGGNAWLVTFDLESTLSLAEGDYWLGLTGATGTKYSFWAISGSSSKGTDFAFHLDNESTSKPDTTTVPEPSPLPLLTLGLVLLVTSRINTH